MIKITKKQLKEEKLRLIDEINLCEKCNFEKTLGFKYCQKHSEIIDYLKTFEIVENLEDKNMKAQIPHMIITKEDLEEFNLKTPINQELLDDTAEMMSNFIMQDWNNDLLQAVNEVIANKREE